MKHDTLQIVVPRGLEPRTLRLLAVRSNQLSYRTSDRKLNCFHMMHVRPSLSRTVGSGMHLPVGARCVGPRHIEVCVELHN